MEVHGDFTVAPGHFHNIDFGSVAAFVADLADAIAHDPERGPVTGLAGHFAAGDVVTEGVLEFSAGVNSPAGEAVAILFRAQEESAFSAQVGIVFYPVAVAAFPVAEAIPL